MLCATAVDGFCPRESSRQALSAVLDVFDQFGGPIYHMLGNHCLYNLPRAVLNEQLKLPEQENGSSYYSFTAHEAWRFVVLDGYDVSMLGWSDGHDLHTAAKDILSKYNPNEVSI